MAALGAFDGFGRLSWVAYSWAAAGGGFGPGGQRPVAPYGPPGVLWVLAHTEEPLAFQAFAEFLQTYASWSIKDEF